jgi:hypothetical protein
VSADHDDRVYAAGILDGEGTVNISRVKMSYGYGYRLRVYVVNTHFPLLLWLQDRWGGSIHQASKGSHHLGTKPCGIWTITGPTAASFLRQIQTYLLIKRSAALNAIAFQAIVHHGRRSSMQLVSLETAYQKFRGA